jgi:chaperonin GroES
MSVHPIRDFIVVSKDEGPKTTASGLYIAHSEEKNVTGTVLAVGSGRVTMTGTVVPLDIKVQDKIVFNRNLATEVKDGENVVLVLREDQVLCVLR